MNAKTCSACGQVSFSANSLAPWLCPYCQHDISDLPLEPASGHKSTKDNQNEYPVRNKHFKLA